MTANHHLHDDEKVDDVERAAGTTTSSSDSISSNNEVTANPPASAAKAEADASTPEAGPTAGETKQDAAPEATTTTAAEADAPEAGRTKLETTLIVLSLCAALFLAALDVTIITTAVPTIAQEFNSNIGYIWIGSAYLLANAAFVPTWGKISDIWGRKPVLLSAVGVFWVGSLLCGLAVDMAMLIAARAIQGIGGGGIIVLVNICISDLFSMRQRGVYFGVMGMVWAVASAVGPVIGGVFTSQVTWRWCFYINLPISGVGIIILFFVLKLHNPRTPVVKGLKAIDWIGTVTIIGGTIMFLFGLEFGGVTYPWSSPTVICLIVFGILTIGLFTVNEWKYARYPVIPMHLFSDWSNLAAFATAFCHAFAFISGSYWLPLYFQGVQGVSSLLSGVYLLPYVLSLSLMSALAGYVIRKTGNYLYLIIAGMAVATLGFGLFHDLPLQRNFTKIVLYQIVAGLGIGPNFQSPLIAVQTSVEPRDIAAATSTFGFIRQMATSISVVIGGVVFNNEMQKQHPRLLAELGPELAGLLSGSSTQHQARLNITRMRLLNLLTAALSGTLAAAASLQQVTSFGANPSGAKMYIYVPDKVAASPPIIVAIHYCSGTASAYYSNTPYKSYADQYGLIVIYPESPYSGTCWDVSSTASLTHNGGGNSNAIANMVTYTLNQYNGDKSKVFVTGTSSGAMMTNVMAATYPELFAAGIAYSGVPAGCFYTGTVNGWNSTCSQGQSISTQAVWAQTALNMYPGYSGARPRMQIYHGSADTTLYPQNWNETIKQWTGVFGYSLTPQQTLPGTPSGQYTKYIYGPNLQDELAKQHLQLNWVPIQLD
ncbi:Efflux pump dotC [Colletotrichum sp. SAR 10_75]|nr:Efflux pump dotC [Colletotrichum sp. SAR 10_75]